MMQNTMNKARAQWFAHAGGFALIQWDGLDGSVYVGDRKVVFCKRSALTEQTWRLCPEFQYLLTLWNC